MKRRDFLRVSFLGMLISMFGKKIWAGKKPEGTLKKAMFWRKLDEQ